ncbi:MAG: hypothetical protein AAF298_24395 [Cyanobacteria bacterium P01_A01_bin.40]
MENNQSEIINIIDPQKAIAAIVNSNKNTTIILDFDETLFLRNSTAAYINSLRPRFVGFILIIILKILRPWKWFPYPLRGDKTRDWFLVTIPTILLPWTLLLWQQRAKKLAEEYTNTELVSAVDQNAEAQIIVASLGFNFIINPILKQMTMKCDHSVGCRFWKGAGDRNLGKLSMMQDVLSESEIKSAILVTDSEDDLPLLQVVRQPYLVLWSSAQYIEPFSDFWLYIWLKKLRK